MTTTKKNDSIKIQRQYNLVIYVFVYSLLTSPHMTQIANFCQNCAPPSMGHRYLAMAISAQHWPNSAQNNYEHIVGR